MISHPASRRRADRLGLLTVPALVVASGLWACARLPEASRLRLGSAMTGANLGPGIAVSEPELSRFTPIRDDPAILGDAELFGVLRALTPRLDAARLRPNDAEHAIRTWGIGSRFDAGDGVAGEWLCGFLTDHARFASSWGDQAPPLLLERDDGVAIRWGAGPASSTHHDHWLSCVLESGAGLDRPVKLPSGRSVALREVVESALRDFRLDEEEVEWTAAVAAMTVPPRASFLADEGRLISLGAIADRLARGDTHHGDCSGTHRIYSLVMILRAGEAAGGVDPATRRTIVGYLARVREALSRTQAEDGHWPWAWSGPGSGGAGLETRHRGIIATSHHLEWMGIAPDAEVLPRDRVRRAARWLAGEVTSATAEDIRAHYPYYSHAARALSLWRGTTPWEFYSRHAPAISGRAAAGRPDPDRP